MARPEASPELLESCHGKFAALEALLREYTGKRILVFTGSSEVAYTISRLYLVSAITRETEPVERKYILDAFRAGRYTVIVTTEELKEGVDVSEAKVAIVLFLLLRARKYRRHLESSLSRNEPLQSTLIEVRVRDTIEDPVFIYEQSDQWHTCHQASPEHQPHKL